MANQTDVQAHEQIAILTNLLSAGCTDEELTRLYIERGDCYGKLNDDVNSVGDYLSGLETAQARPDKVHLKSMIALALSKKDQKEQAVFWAMSAVNDDNCNAEGHHVLGLVCSFCGFDRLAVESLQRAVQLEPDRWEAVRAFGSCLREIGDVQGAIETLSRYVAHYPSEPLGLYELGWSLHVRPSDDNNLRAARDAYEKAWRRALGRSYGG